MAGIRKAVPDLEQCGEVDSLARWYWQASAAPCAAPLDPPPSDAYTPVPAES